MRVREHLVALDVQQSLARRQQRALQAEAGLVELRRLDPVFERRVEVGGAEVERDDARRVLERRVQQLERVAPVTRAVQDVGQVQQRNVLKQTNNTLVTVNNTPVTVNDKPVTENSKRIILSIHTSQSKHITVSTRHTQSFLIKLEKVLTPSIQ